MRIRCTISGVAVEVQLPPREASIFASGKPPRATELVYRMWTGKLGGRHGTWLVGTSDGILFVTMQMISDRRKDISVLIETEKEKEGQEHLPPEQRESDVVRQQRTLPCKFAGADAALEAASLIGGALEPVLYEWRWETGRPWPNRASLVIDLGELRKRVEDGKPGYVMEA